jgi:hypothetical protein
MRRNTPRIALARRLAVLVLICLSGMAACTGSPATLALQPDFEVMTQAGPASVSIRQSPPGMTDEAFTRLVRMGMERATSGGVMAGRVAPPFPSQRIVWHVNSGAPRGISHLAVNFFSGASPYAYEEDIVADGAPAAAIVSTIESMSTRLLTTVTAERAYRPTASRTPGPK